jgi:hypothetical protein
MWGEQVCGDSSAESSTERSIWRTTAWSKELRRRKSRLDFYLAAFQATGNYSLQGKQV